MEDAYKVIIRYNVQNRDDANWDQAMSNAEDIQEEIIRILKTIFDPVAATGIWFTTNYLWSNQDNYENQPPKVERILQFRLFRIKSDKTSVFHGYGGVVKIDVSESEGSGLPGADYAYTEAYDIRWAQRHEILEYPTGAESGVKDSDVPDLFTGDFSGFLSFKVKLKKEDIGSGGHQFPTIGQILTTGELPEIELYHTTNNTEGTPAVLTKQTSMYVVDHNYIGNLEDLEVIEVICKLYKPLTLTVT